MRFWLHLNIYLHYLTGSIVYYVSCQGEIDVLDVSVSGQKGPILNIS